MKEIEEAIGGMAIMSGVWEKAELSVQKDHRIAGLQEVFCGCGTSRSSAEVVDKANCLPFERHCCSTRSHQDDASACSCVVVDKVSRESGVLIEGGRGRVLVKVVSFCSVRRALSSEFWSRRHRELLEGKDGRGRTAVDGGVLEVEVG